MKIGDLLGLLILIIILGTIAYHSDSFLEFIVVVLFIAFSWFIKWIFS